MRLIDVDAINLDEINLLSQEGIQKILDEQPTAYDVDKVVEQLEDMRSKREEQLKICADKDMEDYLRCKISAIAEIIEIVKSGGVE